MDADQNVLCYSFDALTTPIRGIKPGMAVLVRDNETQEVGWWEDVQHHGLHEAVRGREIEDLAPSMGVEDALRLIETGQELTFEEYPFVEVNTKMDYDELVAAVAGLPNVPTQSRSTPRCPVPTVRCSESATIRFVSRPT